jgi:cysteine-rich repeat protein
LTGIQAWYRFEKDLLDSSGNKHHGTLTGAQSPFTAGQCDGSGYSGNTTRYITLSNSPALTVTQSQAMTVAFWARLPTASDTGGIVAARYKNYDTTNSNFSISFGISNGTYSVYVSGNGTSTLTAVHSNFLQWTHVAVTIPKGGASTTIYINGKAAKSGALNLSASVGIYATTLATNSASDGYNPNGYRFKGSLDEVQFYSRALAANEVAWLAENKAPACGDGIIQSQEVCDDGNKTPGDGCSATCQLE